jgi:hypothetical protein
VTQTSETQSQTEAQSQTEQPEATTTPSKQSSRKSILALAVAAIGINTTAAVYTLSPSDFALPDINISSLAELIPHQRLAELLPQQKASDPIPDPVVVALKDIQSAQQQHVASLQENNALLQRNTALLQQDSIMLASLRQSVMDEQVDVKKVSAQITTLISKVDSLQNAITPEVTSSISTRHAYNRLSRVVRKKMARQPTPVGPVSVGGAPLSVPATTPTPQG